jgi:hypothetical protein
VLRQESPLARGTLTSPCSDEAILTADGSLKPRLLAFYDNGVNTGLVVIRGY